MTTLQEFISFESNDELSKFNKKEFIYFLNLLDKYYLEYRMSLGLPHKYTFGIEIEAEYIEGKIYEKIKSYFKQGWRRDSDGTLMNGDEYISPIMIDKEENWKQLKDLCDILKEAYEIKATCGGHIHIGAHILNSKKENWLHFLKLWSAYENIIFRFSYGEFLNYRRGNNMSDYARAIFPKTSMLFRNHDFQYYCEKCNTMEAINAFGLGCKDALNFCNIKNTQKGNGNTIEIRCPNGTLEPIIWQNNINFFIKLILFSKSSHYDEDKIESRFKKMGESNRNYNHIDINQALELADMIFYNNLDKIYFLRQYLKSFQKVKKEQELKPAKTFIKKP